MYIDIETSAGALVGDGPIVTAKEFQTTKRLDRAGTFHFLMPAADERAGLVLAKRIARGRKLVNGAVTEIGAGIIDEISVKAGGRGGAELDVSGDDLLRELTYANVGKLTVGTAGVPVTTGPADIAALFPAGWSLDLINGHGDTLKAIYYKYEGETCLAALGKLAELTGEHFRLGSGRTVIWMQDDRPSSGVRVIQGGEPVGLESNPNVSLIQGDLEEIQNTYDCFIGRLYCYGIGDGDSRINLEHAINNHVVEGYAISSDAKGWYLEHTATWTAYQIERYMSFKDVNDATMLAEQAFEWMSRQLSSNKSYRIKLTKLDTALTVGSTIRVIYKKVVDGFVAVDIDDDLVILETSTQVDSKGMRTISLQVATVDAWPESDTTATLAGLGQSENFYTHEQGFGAGNNADFLVLAASPALPNERIFTPDATLTVIDDGPGGAYHIGVTGGGGSVPPPTAQGDMLVADATPAFALFPLAGFGGYILTRNATDPLWSNTIDIGVDTNIGLVIKGHSATQSANLQEWQTSAGALLLGVDELGNILQLNTTHAQNTGIIYKGAELFLHDFNYGNNGITITFGRNTFVGARAGNLSMGAGVADANNSSWNTGVGNGALHANTAGMYNVAVGAIALWTNSTGAYNTAVGAYALYLNTIGSYNTAIGEDAMYTNVDGAHNTAVGRQALYYNSGGDGNIAVGNYALLANTTGDYNIAVGLNALYHNHTGTRNLAVGYSSLNQNWSTNDNVAMGYEALEANQANYNSAFGNYALPDNTTGEENVAVGYQTMYVNATGSYNCSCGAESMAANTTGDYNTAFGFKALYSAQPTSKAITAFADYGGTVPGTVRATSTGHGFPVGTTDLVEISGNTNYNGVYTITYIDANNFYFTAAWVSTGIGWWSMHDEGYGNTAVGASAGYDIITGTSNTFLGCDAGYNPSQKTDAVNSMALGYGAYTDADNQVVIGNTSVTEVKLNGGAIINDEGLDADTRIEGDADANLFYVDAGTDRIGIGDAAPGEKLDVAGNVNVIGVYKVDDVQVITNRVVDARIDDVPNSGDATTDGIIAAIQACLITHGLAAAS